MNAVNFSVRLQLTICLSLWLTGSAATGSAADAPRKPNVVFILADDLGWTDLACFGSTYYRTPNIDRLAAQGRRFTHGYSAGPNCQPTRAALMSGQYGPRTGIYTVGSTDRFDTTGRPLVPVPNGDQLALEQVTIAEALKAGGYATGMFGKWHLGNGTKFHPAQQGFDEAVVSAGQHFDFKTQPQRDVPAGAYLADWLTDQAVDFIHRKQDAPFFLYLPHFGVHSPFQAKPDKIAQFENAPTAGGHNDPRYAGMIASVDDSVGRIMATLDELKLAENTLVIFTSDNGGVGGYVREGIKAAGDITDNTPLRGGKGMLYEGGVRVPFIFRWPGVIAAGTESTQPLHSIDLYPTLLDVTGTSCPQAQLLDGLSVKPCLVADTDARLDRTDLFWHFPGYLGAGRGSWRTTPAGAIRSGDFKLLEFFEDGRLELYNLQADPGQQTDLAKSDAQRAAELHGKLVAWRESVQASMPQKRDATAAETETTKPAGKRKKKAGK